MRAAPSLIKRAFLPLFVFLAVAQALFIAGNFLLFTNGAQYLALRSVRFCGCVLFLYAFFGGAASFAGSRSRFARFFDVSPLFAVCAAVTGAAAAALSSFALALARGNGV